MGKNLIQQARGKGSLRYRAPSHRYKGKVKFPKLGDKELNGKIIDLVKCPGHTAPLAVVRFDNGEQIMQIAPEGVRVGEDITFGGSTELKPGNVMALKNIPEGTLIFNIENHPGDGGKFCRSGGAAAKVTARMKNRVIVVLPSKKEKQFMPECRAALGVIAAGGRTEKPFVKAGARFHAMKAKNKLYPKVSGVAQNAVDHPFGGSESHHKGKPTIVPKNAPPGRKVGKLRPRRTGRTKR
ncbi:50S ribosomal protein L2 [Candidatus Woesearchaeota archaeon]|nr:50S ribosomal protein L2 [Candidatus Woesearchaeota archaeon]